MDGHSSAAGRSRSSQTPSPSHSASASASSSVHRKRKFPSASPNPSAAAFSVADTGALTSNDELDSISAREEEDETDDEEEEDDADEEEDNDSMRTFTAARLEASSGAGSGNGRSTKPPKPENTATAKIEPSSDTSGKDDRGTTGVGVQQNPAAPVSLMPGIVVKEDPGKGIFTDNIQTSGAYSAREEGLKREEESGKLQFSCYANDGVDEHMIWLIGLKNIFARQLPNMPKEYIVRLVMDRT